MIKIDNPLLSQALFFFFFSLTHILFASSFFPFPTELLSFLLYDSLLIFHSSLRISNNNSSTNNKRKPHSPLLTVVFAFVVLILVNIQKWQYFEKAFFKSFHLNIFKWLNRNSYSVVLFYFYFYLKQRKNRLILFQISFFFFFLKEFILMIHFSVFRLWNEFISTPKCISLEDDLNNCCS